MRTKKLLTFVALLLVGLYSSAQTQFWSDNFEDAGAPSSGSRVVSISEFICSSTQFFKRTDGAEISPIAFSNIQGSKYWAAMDIDRGPGCGAQNTISAGQSITWSGINIAGKSGLSFKGLFGANSGAIFQGLPFLPLMDSMAVEYRIDGGAWTKVVGVYCNDNTGSGGAVGFDLNGDRIGDGGSSTLGNTLAEISANISGTGTSLDLRFDIFLNNSNPGAFAFDNFRLFETAACTAPTITANPPNRAICAGNNTTFTSNASGATAFQWQENSGSGFTDIVNGGVYSNATTNILTITGATAGMSGYLYRCRAMNGVASCFTNTNQATLTISSINTSSAAQTNVSCNGGSNGAASVSPAGGIAPYTYSWSPSGGTGSIATGLTAGSYTVTVTDNIGCQGTRNYTITQPPVLNGSTVVTNVACNGGTNGAINLTPSGGTPGYTFDWGGGVTTEDRTALAAGTYSVTITDANSCTKTVSGINVTQATAISVTVASQTNISCFGGANGAASINTPTGGTAGYSYNWTPGNPSGDGTVSVTGLTATTWTCTVTDANGCTAAKAFTITAPPAISMTANSQTNVSCFGGSNGAAAVNAATGGAGSFTYDWTPGTPTGDGTTSVTGLTAGTWTVTATDANSCTATRSFTITAPPAISMTANSQTNVSCFGGSNGAAAVNAATGGAGSFTYDWTPGTPTGDGTVSVTGLTAGTWTCTATDANGCVASRSFTVTQPTALSVTAASQTNVSCFGGANGAASINTPTGGTAGYTYNWTPGNPSGDGTVSVTGLTATTWTCTVTDANGCVASQAFTVTQPTAISVTAASQTNVSCFGGANGAASINTPTGGTGTYSYNWTPGNPAGDGTVSVTGLTAGVWTCTVTDANSCTASQAFTITQTSPISVTAASQTNVSCQGGANGAAAINTPTGGSGTYSYNWTPGNPTGDGTVSVTGLTAGTWTCTVTDANSCTASQSFTVTQPTALSVTAASQTNVSCNGGSNGAAAINTASGGAGGYTYNWTPGNPTGDGTVSVTGLSATTYTCTVTDANGCVASQSFTVTQPAALSVTPASQTNVSCFGGANGAASINTPTGGAGAYTYNWTPGNPAGDGTTSVTGLTAGTWTCTVTDANSCTASQAFTITQTSPISVTPASQTNVVCNGGANGTATINTPTGGSGTYSYNWTPGNPTGDGTVSVTGLTAGTWTCTVTDANSCTASQAFTITQPATITNTIAATGCDSYTLNGTTYNTSGTYTQVLTSSSGCDSTLTLNLTIQNSTTSIVDATVCSSYTLNGTTYNSSGTYTQTLTNAAGCDSMITLNLIINQPTSVSLTESACNDYTLNGTTYNTSGTYTQTLTNAIGCDSIITLNLTINNSTSSSLTISACDSLTLNGQTYTTSGTYVQTIMNASGCDSVITLSLTINQSTSSSLIETACESYTLNGQTYTTSGTYTQLLTNSAGCDSTITLNLTINTANADTTVATACDSLIWNGQTYTTTGFYTLSFTNVNGCDSILNLDLTIVSTPVAGITSLDVITLQATGTGTYQWINCSGQAIVGDTNATFTATSNGSYAVIVSNGACSDTSDCFVISQVGLDENKNSFGVTLTPNPAQNDVKVTFTGVNEAFIIIYDAQGKVVMTMNQVQSGEMLSLEAFERGVYLVNIMTTSGNHTERLVKQ
jgi:hypothetical protein